MIFDYSQILVIPGVITFPVFVYGEPFPEAPGAEQIDIGGATIGDTPVNVINIGGSLT